MFGVGRLVIVFILSIIRIKGSDASWTNDQEPPPGCVEYSDDEQERAARKQKKNKNENQNAGSNSLGNVVLINSIIGLFMLPSLSHVHKYTC